jgi:hypothetical protein
MKKIFKYSALMLAGLLISTSCKKEYAKINTDPATYDQASFNPNYVLTSAQLGYTGSSDFYYDTWRANLIYCSVMIQGFSSVISYWAGDKYILNPGYTAAYFGFSGGGATGGDGAYPEQVRPIVDVIQSINGKPQYNNLTQVARIMKAMIFERITDLYGDVPYFQAGQGYYEKIFFPVYDKQQDIYMDLLKELSDASSKLNLTGGDAVTGDAYYKGNLTEWKKFANTLMLRVAMRLSKVDPTTAQKYVQMAIGNTFTSNADDAFMLGSVGTSAVNNRNSGVLTGQGGQENFYTRWSKTFIDFLKSNNDPRLSKIACTQLYLNDATLTQNPAYVTDPAVQKGMPNGKDLTTIPGQGVTLDPSFTAFTDYSFPTPQMINIAGPTFILTYGESELLLADAAQRFGITSGGTAAAHYNNGVTAAMTYLGEYDPTIAVATTDAQTYLNKHPYDPANGLAMINNQYWALTNSMLDFYESWSNWRRTGFPVLTPVNYPGNNTNGTIPRRFPYPLTEAGSNTANYNAAHNAVPGGDLLTSRVWWDAN